MLGADKVQHTKHTIHTKTYEVYDVYIFSTKEKFW
jgi:hypothetical protein